MKFTKNIMGTISTLVLVILLTQSRFFNFLTDMPLGRVVLLAFIIFIAHSNKILGLLAVLFIIIAFNQHNMNVVQSYSSSFYEGFDGSGNVAATIVNDKKAEDQSKVNITKQKVTDVKNKVNDTTSTSTTSSSTTSGTDSFTSREGFCMTDRESNMLRGKQSNTIPVFNNSREQDDDISPADKSIFSNSFSSV